MIRNKILVLILISFLFSCTNNKHKNNKVESNDTEITNNNDIIPEKDKKDESPVVEKRDTTYDRNIATKELKEYLSTNPKAWDPLILNYYTVDFLSEGQGAPKDILDLGEWYKFDKDFNYKHGFFDKIIDRGKYSLDIEKKLLLMLPSDKTQAPSEWKILYSGDVIVMVGTAKFGNNPIQKHCQNVLKRPEIE
jgi:hypothetical protein